MHKYYSVAEWSEFAAENPEVIPHIAASSGTGEGDFERLKEILAAVPKVGVKTLYVLFIHSFIGSLGTKVYNNKCRAMSRGEDLQIDS